MLTALLPTVMPIIEKIIDRIPDPAGRERAKAEMESELLKASIEQAAAQSETNKVEAAHASIFVAGWRPMIGWIGAAGLGYQYIGRPLAVGLGWTTLPVIDGGLLELVIALLGLGAMRSFEKSRGLTR